MKKTYKKKNNRKTKNLNKKNNRKTKKLNKNKKRLNGGVFSDYLGLQQDEADERSYNDDCCNCSLVPKKKRTGRPIPPMMRPPQAIRRTPPPQTSSASLPPPHPVGRLSNRRRNQTQGALFGREPNNGAATHWKNEAILLREEKQQWENFKRPDARRVEDARILEKAKQAEEDRRKIEEEARRKIEEEARRKIEEDTEENYYFDAPDMREAGLMVTKKNESHKNKIGNLKKKISDSDSSNLNNSFMAW